MKIRFETTIADVIAFQRFHYANSPLWRRQVWKQTLLVPAILGALFMLFLLMDNRFKGFGWFHLTLVLFFLSLSVLWVIFIRLFMKWTLERNTRKFLSEGSNRALFGWREMELVDNRLIVNLELIRSSYDLRAIEKIVGNDQFTFVYISSVQAFFIPMNLYPEDEYREFVAELRQAWENRDAPRQNDDLHVPVRQPDERIVERPH